MLTAMNPLLFRVALVGCGGIARAHAKAIGASNIVALCDDNSEAARMLSAELGGSAPVFTSLGKLLDAVSPSAVIVCTPPATHFELVRLALEAGADVLCEKPLALGAADAAALVELAAQNGRALRTSAKYRFFAGVVAAKLLLDTGEAGAPLAVEIALGGPLDWARSWHSNIAISCGGVWMDNGPHAVDLARHLAGELQLADVERWAGGVTLETEVALRFNSAAGAAVRIELSWQRTLGEQFAVVRCERGILSVGWHATTWTENGGAERPLAGDYDKAACFAAQWRGFVEGDARFTAADGASTVAIVEAVQLRANES